MLCLLPESDIDPSVRAPLTGHGLPSGRVPVSGVAGPGYPEPVVLHVLVMGVEVIILGEPMEQFIEEDRVQEDVVT